MRCDECVHWTRTHHGNGYSYGNCSEIVGFIDIYDPEGGHPMIGRVETDYNFFCAGFKPKDSEDD